MGLSRFRKIAASLSPCRGIGRVLQALGPAFILTGVMLSGAGQGRPARTSVAAAAGGYSIFHETMADMTWPEVEKAAKDGAVVLTAPAVIEEHGPHLSCGTDAYLGYTLCQLTRRALEARNVKAVIAPPYFWGVNQATHVFPGTFTVRPETMKALLGDMFTSLKSMGFRRICTVNPHGDSAHNKAIIEAILEGNKNLGLDIRYLFSGDEARKMGLTGEPPPWILLYRMPARKSTGEKYADFHAGAFETGAMAAFFPGTVRTALVKTLAPTRVTTAEAGKWANAAKTLTPLGYVGDPARYNPAEARAFMEEWGRGMAEAIAGLVVKAK